STATAAAARPCSTCTCTCWRAGRCRNACHDATTPACAGVVRCCSVERSAFLRRRRWRRRTRHHDHARRVAPRAVTPRAPTTTPERVAPRTVAPRTPGIRALHVDRPLRPQVNRVRGDARIGVVVLADLVLDGAVQRSRHRDLATFGEHFRIVETLLARDEAAEALFIAAAVRPRL